MKYFTPKELKELVEFTEFLSLRGHVDPYVALWGFGPIPPSTANPPQSKTIRCPSCGGDYAITEEFITALPNDDSKIKFPCKYNCVVRVKEIYKRLK